MDDDKEDLDDIAQQTSMRPNVGNKKRKSAGGRKGIEAFFAGKKKTPKWKRQLQGLRSQAKRKGKP